MSNQVWLAKADRCVSSAQALFDIGDPDAACNRAYYAMFNAARAALLVAGTTELAMSKTHNGLIAAFGLHIAKPGKVSSELGRIFAQEGHRRLLSDYHGDGVSMEEAGEAIRNATRFLAAVKEWIADQ